MPSTWLADALRTGGCRVDESVVPDWKSRGHTDGPKMDAPVGVLGHHTAGPASGDLPSLKTVRDGRADLAGPLANLMLSRAGVWVPIAAGRAWHAGGADSAAKWPWVPRGDGNGYLIGIEAESSGTGDWTAAQIEAYPRGVAALLRHLKLGANRFLGHKEWAPSRKPDPAKWPGDMNGFRATVTSLLNGDDMPTAHEITDYFLNYPAYVDGPTVSEVYRDVYKWMLGSDPNRDTLTVLFYKLQDLLAAKGASSAPAAAVNVDAASVAAALVKDPNFLPAIAKAVADENARRQAS